MSTQREMTLDEYLESKLPDFHLARRQLQELREERDALAAHVERKTELLALLVDVPELMGGKWESMARDAINDAPTTSLARRDMSVMAETLEKMARRECGWTQNEIAEQAAELRRQAEGGDHD